MESKPSNPEKETSPVESAEYLELSDAIDVIKQQNQFIREHDPLGWYTGHFLQAKIDGRPKNNEGDVFREVPQEGGAPKKVFKVSELGILEKGVEDYIRMKIAE